MKNRIINSFKYSVKVTFPVLVSYIPVGMAFGVLLEAAGYGVGWTLATDIFVYAGSLQFLMVSFFAQRTGLVSVAIMSALLNSRHIFYGIPFIEKWRNYGAAKPLLIFGLTDECFPLQCTADAGTDRDEKLIYIFNAVLCWSYWAVGTVMGSLIGSLITINTAGIDFAMTSLFIVILMEQLRGAKSLLPAIVAAVSSMSMLLILGPDNFILPSLILTVTALAMFKGKIEKKSEARA